MLKYAWLLSFLLVQSCGYELVKKGDKEDEDPKKEDSPSPTYNPPPSTKRTPSSPTTPKSAVSLEESINDLNIVLSKALNQPYKVRTSIKMVKSFDTKNVIARCLRYSETKFDSRNSIEVSEEMLAKIDSSIKYKWTILILLHEVGHCDFVLPHDFVAIVRSDFEPSFHQGNQLKGYRYQALRKSIMWPVIAASETESLYDLLDDYALEVVSDSFSHPNQIDSFQFSQTNLPNITNLYSHYIYDQNDNFIYQTFDYNTFQNRLQQPLALREPFEPLTEDNIHICSSP